MLATAPPSVPDHLRAELEALWDEVREDQPRMVQYKQYERLCRCSLEALRAAESQAVRLNVPVHPVLRLEVRRAQEAWERLGFRMAIDQILARIRELTLR